MATSVNIYSYNEDDCNIDTISVSTLCDNTWNLATKEFVVEQLSSHENSNESHEWFTSDLKKKLDDFMLISGYGHITAIKDFDGNEIRCDGLSINSFEAITGHVVISESKFVDEYEIYCSSVSELLELLKTDAESKEPTLTIGENLFLSSSNVLNKKDTVFELKEASDNVFGGIYKPTSTIVDDYHKTPENHSIVSEIDKKQNIVGIANNSLIFENNAVSTKIVSLDDDTKNLSVSGGDIFAKLSEKQNTLKFSEPIKNENNSISIDVENGISDKSIKPVSGGVIYDELQLKQETTTFNGSISCEDNFVTVITSGEDTSSHPMSSGEIYSKFSNISNKISKRAYEIDVDNITLSSGTIIEHPSVIPSVDIVKTTIGLVYGTLSKDDHRLITADKVLEKLNEKQQNITIDTTSSGLLTADGDISFSLRPLKEFENTDHAASINSSSLYSSFTGNSEYLSVTDGKLVLSSATTNTIGTTKVDYITSYSSTNTLANSSVSNILSEKMETVSIDSNTILQNDTEEGIKVALIATDKIEESIPYAVSGIVLSAKFGVTQLSSIEGEHIHINSDNVITNDLQSTPATAIINGDTPGETIITNMITDEAYGNYAVVGSGVYAELEKKNASLTFTNTDFRVNSNTPHTCAFENTAYIGSSEFPETAVNGKTIYSILSSKQNNIAFIDKDFTNNENLIGLQHGGLSETVEKPVSGGAIYEKLKLKQKTTSFSNGINVLDNEVYVKKFADGMSNQLPVSGGFVYTCLSSKSSNIDFNNSDFKTENSQVSILSGSIDSRDMHPSIGFDVYSHIQLKEKKIVPSSNITIDENNYIDKIDSKYALPQATASISGGVTIGSLSESSSSVTTASEINKALTGKENLITINENNFSFINNVLGLNTELGINNPVSTKYICEELSGKQELLHTTDNDSIFFYRGAGGNLYVSSTSQTYIPSAATEDTIGVITKYSKNDNAEILTSANYALPCKYIREAFNSVYGWEYDTSKISTSYPYSCLSLIYGNVELNDYRACSCSSVSAALDSYQDLTTFNSGTLYDEDFTVTEDSTAEIPASSVKLNVNKTDEEYEFTSERQLAASEIYKLYKYNLNSKNNILEDIAHPLHTVHKYSLLNKCNSVLDDNNYCIITIPPSSSYGNTSTVRDFTIIRKIHADLGNKKTKSLYFADPDKSLMLNDSPYTDEKNWSIVRSTDNEVYAYNSTDGLWISTTCGKNWSPTYIYPPQSISDIVRYKNGNIVKYLICMIKTDTLDGGIKYSDSSDFANCTSSKIGSTTITSTVYSMCQYGSTLFAASTDGVLKSTDGGATWVATTYKQTAESIYNYDDTRILIGSGSGGGLSYTDDGFTTVIQSNITTASFHEFAFGNGYVLALSDNAKIYSSTDYGASWNESYSSISPVSEDTFHSSHISFSNGTFIAVFSYEKYVIIVKNSFTYGETWSVIHRDGYNITDKYSSIVQSIETSNVSFKQNGISVHNNIFTLVSENDNYGHYGRVYYKNDDSVVKTFAAGKRILAEPTLQYIPYEDNCIDINLEEQKYLYSFSETIPNIFAISLIKLNLINDYNALTQSIIDGSISRIADNSISIVGKDAFAYCENLKSVYLPNATSIGYRAFEHCISLKNVQMDSVSSIGKSAFNMDGLLTSARFLSCKTIGPSAFSYVGGSLFESNIVIQIPNVTSIDVSGFYELDTSNTVSIEISSKTINEIKTMTGFPFGAKSGISFKGSDGSYVIP